MKTKKSRILTMLMAIVFLSGGLVFGEAEMSEAADVCDGYNGYSGGISGVACEEVQQSADWWCTGAEGDCANAVDAIDYNFCDPSGGPNIIGIICRNGIPSNSCFDEPFWGSACSAWNITETECPPVCVSGFKHSGTCIPVYSGDPAAGCVRGAGAICSHSVAGVCDDSVDASGNAAGCCNILPGFKCYDDDGDGVEENCRLAAAGLSLSASANPTAVAVTRTSNITFKVTKSGSNESGATVNGISVAGGGSVSSGSCTTNVSGECTITFTAPAAASSCTISATHASNGVDTNSGPASAIVTVSTSSYRCDSGLLTYGDDCPPPVTDIGTCVSLNGDTNGCVGTWQNCDNGCNSNCSDVCGTCVTKYDACDCDCVAALPACNNDGAQNNGETGVDCGGGGCPACVGPGCNNDGAQNNGETGIDCGGGGCPACGGGGGTACDPNSWFFCNPLRGSVSTLAQGAEKVVGYVLGLIGSIALLLIIISGAMYMTAGGSEEKATTAKKVLTGAVIGLGIALLAFSLLQVVIGILNA